MKSSKAIIPTYDLEHFKHTHRENTDSIFGYNNLDKSLFIKGFELYSSEGLATSVGPLKSAFYRMSLTVRGTLDMLIGLDNFKHQPRTISVTYPNQVFAKNNISSDAFGYYMLFSSDFLNDLVPSVKLAEEFPFFETSGTPLFRLAEDEMVNIINLISKIDDELKRNAMDKVKAVKMYLYLTLLEVKRSYERQQLHTDVYRTDSAAIVARFRKLVSRCYLSKRRVADYAALLSVSANYLNKVVKAATSLTASDTIKEMLILEAKSLLKNSDQTVSEIAYMLNFSDPASFNRFFKAGTRETPLTYRSKCN